MTIMTIVIGYSQSSPEAPKVPITKTVDMVDSDGKGQNGGISILPAPHVLEMLATL